MLLLLLLLYAIVLIRMRRSLLAAPPMSDRHRATAGCSAPSAIGCRSSATSLFALFPLFWLVKISVTPDNAALHRRHPRCGRRATTLDNFDFVLLHSDFPTFFLNSVIVSRGDRRAS